MKKTSIILTLCLSTTLVAQGQETPGVCGTSADDQAQYTARLQANIARVERGEQVAERGAIQYVPIHFHIVGDGSGNGKHREAEILDQLCDLNEAYAPMDMRFYLRSHSTYGIFDYTINSNNVYNNQSNNFLMQTRRHPNALNVFVVNDAGSTPGGGVVLAYYSPPDDWVVSRKDQINGTENGTLPHEIGHFFSLRHTFYGYETDPFDTGDSGWPIAPVIAPYHPNGANIPTERQNTSNCSTAADLICDTPPDYNFGLPAGNCDAYTGGAKDPLETLVDPMENNAMGYFSDCDFVFTPMQQDVVLADRENADRNYLDNNYTPPTEVINTPIDLLVAPPSGDTTEYFDEVLLEWQAVSGSTYYLIEMDILLTYNSPNYRSYVVPGTSKLLTDLQPNRKYFWRVRPFNEYVTCAQSRQRDFRTSTTSGTIDIKELSGLQVAPNPVSGADAARLFVSATDSFEAAVSIFDATGRQVCSLGSAAFAAGDTARDLPVEGLATGLYFVVVENSSGRTVRKMTIVR